MHSLTSDGDSECFALAQQHYSQPVAGNRDPNHYQKGLVKDVEALARLHPVLAPVVTAIRKHFYVCLAWYGKRNDEQGFRRHWKTFIPHITDTDHDNCLHEMDKPATKLLDIKDAAIAPLRFLMESFLDDAHLLAHGFETNHLEALNGKWAK